MIQRHKNQYEVLGKNTCMYVYKLTMSIVMDLGLVKSEKKLLTSGISGTRAPLTTEAGVTRLSKYLKCWKAYLFII